MSKFKNFYRSLGEFGRSDYYNPHGKAGALIHPFRCIICGESGTGKSNSVLLIINNCACFKKIYIVSANANNEPLYVFLKHKMGDQLKIIEDVDDLPELPSTTKTDKQKKLERKQAQTIAKARHHQTVEEDSYSEHHSEDEKTEGSDEEDSPTSINGKTGQNQKLIIFEDQVFESRERRNLIGVWFSRARNANFSVIMTSQTYYDIPRPVRINSNYCILFRMSQAKDIARVLKEFDVPMSIDQFIKSYRVATADPMNFMLIDRVTKDPNHRVRHNFAHVIEPVNK